MQRTNQQNKSIYKLFQDISTHCIAHGIDQKTVVEHLKAYECPTTPEAVKATWKVIQFAMTGKKSTAELTRGEIDLVFGAFSKLWSEITGLYFPFPSYEALLNYEDN
jgi:hypothetical protein